MRRKPWCELSRHNDAEPLTLDAARALYQYKDFTGFMLAFKAITERLRTPDDYELITYRMIEALAARESCTPKFMFPSALCTTGDASNLSRCLKAWSAAELAVRRNSEFLVLWIFDAVRHFGPEEAARVFQKAAELKQLHPSIVGIGIGGDERRTGAEPFRDLYAEAKKNGLHLTAHAGETVGPEGIWSALNIGAERIGHALSAGQDPELIEVLATRQMPVRFASPAICARDVVYALRIIRYANILRMD